VGEPARWVELDRPSGQLDCLRVAFLGVAQPLLSCQQQQVVRLEALGRLAAGASVAARSVNPKAPPTALKMRWASSSCTANRSSNGRS
jgi:hypothetical protein